jgi:hypothetical protein
MDLAEFRKYVPYAPDYLFQRCATISGGGLTKGLLGAVTYLTDSLPNLLAPDAERLLIYYIYSLPPPAGVTAARLQEVADLVYELDQLLNYYLSYFLLYSGELFIADLDTDYDGTKVVLLVFVTLFSVFLLGFYLVMFKPMSAAISKTSNQAKSLMLILPPEAIAHIAAAKHYIDEQISNE